VNRLNNQNVLFYRLSALLEKLQTITTNEGVSGNISVEQL